MNLLELKKTKKHADKKANNPNSNNHQSLSDQQVQMMLDNIDGN